mmetsp:Transcript_78433/g.123628  ORF Transcript_78433/g.123628 Transcript_78433/m.123628 type:complete len:271 (+) Transcript_78433:457-1269(+)
MQQRNQAVVRVRGAAQRRLVGVAVPQGGVVMQAATQNHGIVTLLHESAWLHLQTRLQRRGDLQRHLVQSGDGGHEVLFQFRNLLWPVVGSPEGALLRILLLWALQAHLQAFFQIQNTLPGRIQRLVAHPAAGVLREDAGGRCAHLGLDLIGLQEELPQGVLGAEQLLFQAVVHQIEKPRAFAGFAQQLRIRRQRLATQHRQRGALGDGSRGTELLQQILWITHVAVDIHHSKHLSMKRIAQQFLHHLWQLGCHPRRRRQKEVLLLTHPGR